MIFEDRNRTDGDGLAPAEQKLRENLTRTGFCWCGFFLNSERERLSDLMSVHFFIVETSSAAVGGVLFFTQKM